MKGHPPTPEHIALTCSRCGEFVAWAFPPVPPVAVVGACCAVEPVCVCPPDAGIEDCLEADCPACDSVPIDRPCRRAEPPSWPAQGPGDYAGEVPPLAAPAGWTPYRGAMLPAPAYLAQERGEAP